MVNISHPRSSTGNWCRTSTLAAATALGAAAILWLPVPAQAQPCNSGYQLNNAATSSGKSTLFLEVTRIDLGGPVLVTIPTYGNNVGTERASHTMPNKPDTYGNARGGISGDNINITVDWTNGPGAGVAETFTGIVTGDGFSTGTTSYNKGVAHNNWRSKYKHFCVKPPAPPAPAPAPEPAPAPAPGPEQPAPGGEGRPNDRDSDGLLDWDESNVYNTNPDKADTDGDGPDDGQEVYDGTDPLIPNPIQGN